MDRLIAIATLCITAVVAVPLVGHAECISIPGTDQQIFDRYPIVFVGDVLAVDAVLEPTRFNYRVRFRVIEAFKGVETGEQTLDFATSFDDFKFEVGTRVVVYTARSEDRHSTACSPTRVVYGDGVALLLRKLASGAKRP